MKKFICSLVNYQFTTGLDIGKLPVYRFTTGLPLNVFLIMENCYFRFFCIFAIFTLHQYVFVLVYLFYDCVNFRISHLHP
jgi:hypothetical protein